MRLNQVVDEALRESQATIDLSVELHNSLEREDDALLLFLSGNIEKAREDLQNERQRGDDRFTKLLALVGPGEERELALSLRQSIDRYRAAGDTLLRPKDEPSGLEEYHLTVNPLLRLAVANCDQLREANFRTMEEAGVRARDEAARSTRWVTAICFLMIVLGVAVAVWLARSVLVPVRELSESVEAIREGNFDRRVAYNANDELGQLAAGFNRMAAALQEYRQCSLGELLAAKMTLEAIINALPDAVFVFGPDRTLEATNPPAERILASKGSVEAKRLEELPLPEGFKEAVREALSGQPPPARGMDFANLFSLVLDNRERRFLLTAVPVAEFAPRRFGAVVVLDDVTAFARLDELRSELIGVASHELKSPLTALQMNLLMLREGASGLLERQRELIEASVSGCEELGQTIDELLDMTRIEAGQLRLNPSMIDTETLVSTVKQSLEVRFADAGVRLEIVPPEQPVLLWGDRTRLQSVLANLLSNALKYSPPGGRVQVEISSRQNAQMPGGGPVQIAVSDQGPGIPEEFRERIFEKFFRVEHYARPNTKEVRGTGIGLYLCREIIQSHGGTIVCHSGQGGIGTRFVITFPANP
jgi:NtrC-family two-component system sensor histidine kinase KinB